ncbi:MAG: hypothetical protein GY777_24200 [Candidatus Brocadiaceae bacterium]|nr:hypothetical protein [Candidatus Brocadiaceae bacterium]
MQKNLIIFEYTDEVEIFIAQRSLDELKSEYVNIIAIQPDVQAYLKRKEILYSNTTKFFTKESHQNILLKSAEIIEPFRALLNIRDCLGIKEGYNNAFVFYLRHYSILYLLWQIEVVHNAIDRLRPEKLIAVKMDYYPDAMDSIPRNERYLGIIVEKIAEKRGLQVELFTGKKKHYNSIVEKTKLAFLEIIKTIIFQINMALFGYKSKGRKYVLYSSASYNLTKVIQSLISKYDRLMYALIYSNHKAKDLKRMFCDDKHWNMLSCLPAYLSSNKRSGFLKELNKTIIMLKEFFSNNREILRYKGIDFQELVFLKIKESMIPFLINMHGQTYYLDKFIRNKNPVLVLSQMARGLFYNLGELASFHNIPSVLISHGSHVPASNRYAELEWGEHGLGLMNTHYKYIAIQSPWALRYLKSRPSNSIPIITGPLLFTKIKIDEDIKLSTKKRIVPQHYKKTIILHASTPKLYQAYRPYVYETVDEYIENINSLIRAVEKLKEVHLIVRFRPFDNLTLSDFQELLVKSSCYSVHSKGTFKDYLTIADLLVSYSSTTIEEALQNRVPVLQYDAHGKYCHIKGQILDPSLKPEFDSCYYVGSEKILLWAIRWLYKNHLTSDISDNVWERHVFNDREKVELPSYFRGLFQNSK